MDKIRFQDINFSSLQRLSQHGSTATLYKYGNICVKILDKIREEDKEKLHRKFLDMGGIEIENVLLPKGLILQDGKLQGYVMDYFADSNCLTDQFMVQYVDSKKLFACITKASKILRSIHEASIIYQDLSFENILVDKRGNIAFCDIDGCSYEEHTSPFVSMLMRNYFINYRGENIILSKNLDRVSMLLAFYYLVYEEEIQNLSRRQYNKLSRKISTLEILKQYFNMLINISRPIDEVPYLDDVIDSSDDYVFDREKQLKFMDRMLGRF